MNKWLWVLVIIVVLLVILVVYNLVMMKNSKPILAPNPTLGDKLISWMQANHQTFSLRGQIFFQISPSDSSYDEIIYTPADADRFKEIINQNACAGPALIAALESLTDQSTQEELQTKLACLGPLVFTPVPFSSD